MKIDDKKHHLTLDFEIKDAEWRLLVVDDKWDTVKRLIVGFTDPVDKVKIEGLGEKCLNYESAYNHWKKFNPSQEPFDLTLFLLPWMVNGTEGIRSVTFCGFPGTKERLTYVMHGHLEDYVHLGWIFLIDVRDTSIRGEDEKERFQETWKLLDELGYPNFVRARFTRGGVELPESVIQNAPVIYKEPPQGMYPQHKHIVQDWLRWVQGHINDALFQNLTIESCHNPSEIINAKAEDRQRICAELSSKGHDFYGAWRWCSQEASLNLPPSSAANRWLACKAFQTSDIHSGSVPVTAVIAICAGAPYIREDSTWKYTVESPLMSVANENINKLPALGGIVLAKDKTYGGFAKALRSWLVHLEQFEQGKAHIASISIANRSNDSKIIISMRYSDKLPEAIFSSSFVGRRGRVRRVWDELSSFAAKTSHDANVVSLEFDWTEYV